MTDTAASSPATAPGRPFGRVLTAMVTPMTAGGDVDLDGAARLAAYLLEHGSDGLVLSGTTGESATTSDVEKEQLLRAVLDAVGDRAIVLAGVGSNDTAHTLELAAAAEKAGAHGLLAVTPYYNKPPQAGLIAHFTRLADAAALPIMLYDIPGRTGVPLEVDTIVTLAEHPNIVALKDAKLDLGATSWVKARCDIALYSGQDEYTLPLLAVGGVGVVGVVTHIVGEQMAAMVAAFERGDVDEARAVHLRLMPVFTGMFRTQGLILTKAALAMFGLPAGPVRLPLVDATPEQRAVLRADLARGGVPVPA
jgi:4-hydroxy-tetrahydrodipicolinate synthase